MIKSTVAKRLRRGVSVLGEDLLLERTRVHADTDRNTALTAGVGNRLDPVVGADVAGVDADLVHARGARLERELIVEVNVRDNGSLDGFLEGGNQPYRVHIGNRGADDLTARLLERHRLSDGALDICGGDVEHGLHADRSAAADEHVPRFYLNFATHIFLLLQAREGSRDELPNVLG